MTIPVLSTIIPVYKSEQYIRECLEAVILQLPDYVEIVIVDDGSPDSSMEIVNSVMAENPTVPKQFKIVTQNNKGLSAARNAGILSSLGKYVTFLDSDDFPLDGYFSNITKVINDNPRVEIISFNAAMFQGEFSFENSKEINTYNKKPTPLRKENSIIDTCISGQWHACFRAFDKRLFLEKRFKEGRRYEDIELVPELYFMADSCIQTNYRLYGYRISAGSITSNPNISDIEDLESIVFKYVRLSNNDQAVFVIYSALETMHRLNFMINPNRFLFNRFHELREIIYQKPYLFREIYYSNLLKISFWRALLHVSPACVFLSEGCAWHYKT
jgi:glycosyltransferase involved in cell wall biosynthesis